MSTFMDTEVNDKVKEYLQKISKEYEFKYMFKGERYGLVNNLNLLKNPVLVLPPENDEIEYAGKMKICAYGGSIASINTENGWISLSDSKNAYAKYLIDGHKNKKVYQEEFRQDGLFDHIVEGADKRYIDLKNQHKDSLGEIDRELLDLMVFAKYTRYLNRKLYKEYPSFPHERSMQYVLAKNNMLQSKYTDDKESMVVIDVETHLFHLNNKHPRADFVVFDGTSFGLIEFKYLGQSMDSEKNDLKKHYEDFCTAMNAQNGKKLFEQLKMKLKYQAAYGVIDDSWREKVEEMCKREYDKSVLWCGFYFLGDATDIPGESQDTVKASIKSQLEPVYGNTKARCQISGIDPKRLDEIRMDMADISSIWKVKNKDK